MGDRVETVLMGLRSLVLGFSDHSDLIRERSSCCRVHRQLAALVVRMGRTAISEATPISEHARVHRTNVLHVDRVGSNCRVWRSGDLYDDLLRLRRLRDESRLHRSKGGGWSSSSEMLAFHQRRPVSF